MLATCVVTRSKGRLGKWWSIVPSALRSEEGPTMSDPYAETIVPVFTRAPFFEILAPEATGQKTWRWRFKAGNGEVLAQGEPQMSREACVAAIGRVKAGAATAEIR